MSDNGINALMERVVNDADFRARLFRNPEETIAAEGYVVPAEVVEKIKSVDQSAVDAAVAAAGSDTDRMAAG